MIFDDVPEKSYRQLLLIRWMSFEYPIKHELKTMCDSTNFKHVCKSLKMDKFVTMELIIR